MVVSHIYRRRVLRLLALPLMVVALLILAWNHSDMTEVAAHADHPDIAIALEINETISSQCLGALGGPATKCDVGVGRTFQVKALLGNPGGIAFDAVQFAIEYSGVVPKDNADISFPECLQRTDPIPQPATSAPPARPTPSVSRSA